ncbi:TPR repeat-containing thioredoxin TTL1-like [Impatiens glandulifera]|uniref:TPR repeat-containing thioredoxin TTL1-like n=1 Tax=Impatiens glandulifera TaxID=253017 RepID=UPI001FB1132C|nr:TPR repeat-containing thioredoxin TTL1-like [Impatiens glandulifera]
MAETAAETKQGCGLSFPCRSIFLRKSSAKSLPSERNKPETFDLPSPSSKPRPKQNPKVTTTTTDHKTNETPRPLNSVGRTSTSSDSSGRQNKAPLQPVHVPTRKPKTNDDPTPRATPTKSGTILPLAINMGNIIMVKRSSLDSPRISSSSISSNMKKLDAEVVKNNGNLMYKEGRFKEALALYDKAIVLEPNRAWYHCNKGAALIGLGRLLEAVFACQQAINLDPSYRRAHHRLATLYFRLGETGKALEEYKLSGIIDESEEVSKCKFLKENITKCVEARDVRDWNILLKESRTAMSSGADFSPLLRGMEVEALFRLRKHQQAYTTYQNAPCFEVDSCTKLFGPSYGAYLLAIRARAYLIDGRFDEAVEFCQRAAKLAPGREINELLSEAKCLASARSNGNLFFKESKFVEACFSYSEGLELDPYNPIMLCNRAACRFKLRQFEKAAEDCSLALNVRPTYNKARLRRAHCNAKMERWEAAIQDYEMLTGEDEKKEEVEKALNLVRAQLERQRIQDSKRTSNCGSVGSGRSRSSVDAIVD